MQTALVGARCGKIARRVLRGAGEGNLPGLPTKDPNPFSPPVAGLAKFQSVDSSLDGVDLALLLPGGLSQTEVFLPKNRL